MMKLLSLLLILSTLGLSCSSDSNIVSRNINLAIIDKENNLPIDSAQVTLTSIVEVRDIYTDIRYTDSSGMCSFAFEFNPVNDYRLHAQKEGYWSYLVNDSANISKSDRRIVENTEENIILYLTSDSMHHADFWANKMIRFDIDTLITLLKAKQYRYGIPKLEWTDIPKLLAVGNDTAMVAQVPCNPVSSMIIRETNLGFVALWFIESIRITERDNIIYPFERYPSRAPMILDKDSIISLNNLELLQETYDAYSQWWASTKQMDHKEASRIDPLENKEIMWN